jgi:hypothetical protein
MEDTGINAADTLVEKNDSVNATRSYPAPYAIVIGAETRLAVSTLWNL